MPPESRGAALDARLTELDEGEVGHGTSDASRADLNSIHPDQTRPAEINDEVCHRPASVGQLAGEAADIDARRHSGDLLFVRPVLIILEFFGITTICTGVSVERYLRISRGWDTFSE